MPFVIVYKRLAAALPEHFPEQAVIISMVCEGHHYVRLTSSDHIWRKAIEDSGFVYYRGITCTTSAKEGLGRRAAPAQSQLQMQTAYMTAVADHAPTVMYRQDL